MLAAICHQSQSQDDLIKITLNLYRQWLRCALPRNPSGNSATFGAIVPDLGLCSGKTASAGLVVLRPSPSTPIDLP